MPTTSIIEIDFSRPRKCLRPHWSFAPENPAKSAGIHVWRHYFTSMKVNPTHLNASEIIHAHRLHSDNELHRFCQSRAFLRNALAQYLEQPSHEITFWCDEDGSLHLKNVFSSWRFDFAQSENVALLVATEEGEVALSLEHVTEDVPYHDLADFYFDQKEHALPNAKQMTALDFFEKWTAEDALTKLKNKNRLLDPTLIHFHLPEHSAALAFSHRPHDFHFWDWCF